LILSFEGISAFHQVFKMELLDHGFAIVADLVCHVFHIQGVKCVDILLKTALPLAGR
jgi:hypothetical protein